MSFIVGMDEVGRGALAGPVVAAAACFDIPYAVNDPRVPVRIDDSKKLTAKQRAESASWIYKNAVSVGIGKGSVTRINNRGIVGAAHFAFRMALREIEQASILSINYVLIDAFYIPRLGKLTKSQQQPIIKGDQKEFSIAAASIVAKVYRDSLMQKLGNCAIYLPYNWVQNKGYGTSEHTLAIKNLGTTKHHRKLFVRNYA